MAWSVVEVPERSYYDRLFSYIRSLPSRFPFTWRTRAFDLIQRRYFEGRITVQQFDDLVEFCFFDLVEVIYG